MKKRLRFVFLFLSLLAVVKLTAQTFGSEAELKAKAAKLFDDDQFEEAYPLYAQLASLYNKDPNYSYRLGVCMLYASEDKEKPIPFLEFAAKSAEVEKEVFFYLAKAYHLNYRFDDAIKQYYAYQKVASGPKAEKLQVARQIEMCKNGKQLLRNISDLMVIDKKEMSRADFYRSYDISAIGGKLLAKPDENTFKTAIDKKKKESSIIYFSSDNNQIYFASYGEDGSNGKDIYMVRKLPNGELSKPQTLGYPVNTEYDEDYPFLHPNGKVLYFCSKGHNSMGGYDIFKTTLNELTNTWNKPVNLDFPINSPDDDILYITNKDEKEAYFSSARSSATGKTAVYHINVDRKPVDATIVKGTVIKKSQEQNMNVKITIKDMSDNTILGIFNTNPENGDFTLNLPGGGGKVMYTVEAPGFSTQSEIITLPAQTTLAPLKQEITYGDDGKLAIKNFFDQPVDQSADENYLAALKLIKEKSRMEVNVNEIKAAENKRIASGNLPTANKSTSDKPTVTKPANLSNEEIVKIAYTDAKDAEKEAKELKEQADIALVIANQKNEASRNRSNEAAKLAAEASAIADNTKKQAALAKVEEANKDVANMNQITVSTYNVAKALEMKAEEKKREADLSLQYAKDLEAAVKSKTPTEAISKLEVQQKKLEEISQKNDASSTISTSLKFDAENKKKELDKAIKTSADIKQEIADNEAAITTTEAEIEKEKNDNIKQGMRDQVQGLKDDIASGKKDLEANEVKVNQLQKDYNGITNQIELFNSVVDKAKTENNENMAVTVAAIDKAKLERQVNELKSADNSLNSIKPISTTISTTGEEAKETTSVTPSTTQSTQTGITKKENATNKPVSTTGNIETSVETSATEVALTDEAIAAQDKKYEEELISADIISDQTQKETKKAEVYESWTASIRKTIDAKKQELNTEPDAGKKTELTATIATLEKKLSAKEQSQKETQSTVEKLKQETSVVVNTGNDATTKQVETSATNPPETAEQPVSASDLNATMTADATQQVATFENTYNQEIVAAEQSGSDEEKEEKKLKAATEYVNSITLAVNAKKSELGTETDAVKQQELTQDIEVMQRKMSAKQKIAEQSSSKLASIKKSGTPGTSTPAESTPPVGRPIVDIPTDFSYTNSIAKDNVDKAAALDKEAEAMLAESKALKEQAILQNDVTEKNAMFTRADDMQHAAESKKLEAAQLQGTANIAQYRNNQHTVDQYLNGGSAVNDQTSVAELMNDEAKLYFEKAQNSRKAAASFETNYAKQTALEDANKNEQIALQKQNNAIAIYKKNNPKLVIRPMSVADIAVTKPRVTTPSENDNTIADVTKKTEENGNRPDQPSTEQPVVKSNNITNEKTVTQENTNTNTPINPVTDNTVSPVGKESQTTTNPVTDNTTSPVGKESQTTTNPVTDNTTSPVGKESQTTTNPVTDNTTSPVGKESQTTTNPVTNNTTTPVTKETTTITNSAADNVTTPVSKETSKPVVTNNSVDIDKSVVSSKTKNNVLAKKGTNLTTGTKISKELFEKRSKSIYSAAHPIPIDEALPEGLIFKVQMGAFKNAIPQDLFKGIAPVSGQTTPQGFIRYSAGLFLSCETAEKAKAEIRALGFPDAFIIAFMDGKRIPPPCGTEPTIAVTTPKTETPVQPAVTEPVLANTPVAKPVETVTTPVIPKEIAVSTDVTTISGLFYTIQVGVYSNPITGAELNNINPLYTENANNLIRYNVGIYNSIPLASEAKKIAIGGGLKDAFMTIYYNGKRISMVEASTLTAQGINPIADAPNLNKLPSFKGGAVQPSTRNVVTPVVKTDVTQSRTTQTDTKPSTTIQPETEAEHPAEVKPTLTTPVAETPVEIEKGVVFKVQIGAFKEEVPLEIANKFLKISKKGIKNYKDENGLTIYTVGKYASYEEADKSRQEVAAEGLADAFVVAYSDGKKISVEEAQKIIGNK